MRKVIIGAAFFVLAVAALRRFGPALHSWAMTKCGEMFDRMPEDFPPKRLLQNLEEIGEQNTRILRHLEQQDEGSLSAAGEGDVK